MNNKHVGSNVEAWLKDEGMFEHVEATAIKRVIAFQIEEAMKTKKLTKTEMTKRMKMKSRAQLDRLLDPDNVSVTLLTLEKAAHALGKKLQIKLV